MARKGRPPLKAAHARKVEGSDEAKERLELILKTLSGELSVAENVELSLVYGDVPRRERAKRVAEALVGHEALEQVLAGPEGIASFTRFTVPFNFTGHPTITMPGGFDDNSVPIGFQLVAPHLAEARLVSVGRGYQAATDWHRRRPPI